MMMMMKMIMTMRGGGVGASVMVERARGGEWYGGSYRSDEEESFWYLPEKPAGKVFRRRRRGGGRRWGGRERKKMKLCGKPQHNDKGFVDTGCSRHMTGNIAYLSDFKQFDEGYVAFGGGAYGGKITSKGTLKTTNLDFEDDYFVNELKFNLFSVSQMCDKKNYVFFIDTECLVLSPNFKLPDEN
ncbi:hypothetical protein Tco_0656084 [Tanacetum coccineum]|uniref:Retrovirus-related Pol polyprotein from transposon TNT 1-94-like beta-barrel domain-containing protein n=1 Tax=Tanacetum coccineum TaxID=301880 RepID=A0ABQ4X8Y5_9ASTR